MVAPFDVKYYRTSMRVPSPNKETAALVKPSLLAAELVSSDLVPHDLACLSLRQMTLTKVNTKTARERGGGQSRYRNTLTLALPSGTSSTTSVAGAAECSDHLDSIFLAQA